MTFDPSKLSPAPWKVQFDMDSCVSFIPNSDGFPMLLPERECLTDLTALEFAALARNAFDVMMRRDWHPERWDDDGNWFAVDNTSEDWIGSDGGGAPILSADPFTALVEADRWYRENVEAKP